MKFKKVFFFFLLFIIVYLGAGSFLLYIEVIQRLYFLPGWSIKHGKTDEDFSTISSDGPIIIYSKNQILNYQINPSGKGFLKKIFELSKKDSISCFVDDTKDSFCLKLKDTLLLENAEYIMPKKMLVISDIEGNFKGFKSILLGNKIIDNKLNWIYGNNHLVLLGDFFDRGLNVTECLWLIYKLESESEKQGGKVHFILGNHEMMNLKGQYKYLRDKYIENADFLNLDYDTWYASHTELGKWLRTKNGVEKIGNLLFVHGGIRRELSKKYSLFEINKQIRISIDKKFEKNNIQNDLFIGNESPLWYRGIANRNEKEKDLDNTLLKFGVKKMIIGHTIFDHIQYLYNQKVIVIDLDHKANMEKGKMYALLFENNEFKITDIYGNTKPLK